MTERTAAGATARDLLDYIAASPTPFHAVAAAIERLHAAGFAPLDLRSGWSPLAAGRYYVSHGDTSLVAFRIPEGKAPLSFRMVGAHTDSPNLRLKPKAEYVKEGYVQLGVEVYGGALLNSWLDRDLGLAGRVILRDGARLVPRLVRIGRPLARVTQLAIHLDRDVNEKGVALNKQEHMPPLCGLTTRGVTGAASAAAPSGKKVRELVAAELGAPEESIASMELMLYDLTAPTFGGLDEEMLFSARLDNLAMCHASITALVDAKDEEGIVPLAVLFDHEEVGSGSAYGAGSPLLPTVLERLVLARTEGGREAYHRALAASLCVSADMAHAVHPNYPDRHEARHKPVLNGGPVIKVNNQQRYATCGRTAALFQEICRAEDIPVQHYAHRTDLPCGSTIGPITSTLLGVRTVDVGNPMLSMHSARELGGTEDPHAMVRALRRFYATTDPFGP